MSQQPVPDLDGDAATSSRFLSARRPFLAALSIGAVAVAVALAGITGPRLGDTSASSASAGLAGNAVAAVSGAVGPARTPQTNATSDPDLVTGLENLRIDAADIASTNLGSSVVPMAANAGNLLYSSGEALYLANPKGSSEARPIARASSCARIIEAAMNASLAIYAEIGPAGSIGAPSELCRPWTSQVDWRIATVDLLSRDTRQIAAGTLVSSTASWSKPESLSVAISDQLYAFGRPDPVTASATVEVRQLDGDGLVFQSDKVSGLSELELADSRLVLVADPAPTDPRPHRKVVMETDVWASPLQVVGYTSGPVSLSHDGNQLAFASCDQQVACKGITLFNGTQPQNLELPFAAQAVAVDTGNLQTIVWQTDTTPDNPTSYVGLENALWPMQVALVGLAPPNWISLQADTLLLVSVSPGGLVELFEINLKSAGLDR